MKREDYIELIVVADGFRQYEEAMRVLNGCSNVCGKDDAASKLIRVINVLSRNALPEYDFVSPDNDCSEQFHKFNEVLENNELTAEEKCDILLGKHRK